MFIFSSGEWNGLRPMETPARIEDMAMTYMCPIDSDTRHASYRYDEATGLYYCWNRYYAPELARFLTRDIYPGELSDPVTMNPYLYCGGDPVNSVDPSGMSWEAFWRSVDRWWLDSMENITETCASLLEWFGDASDAYGTAETCAEVVEETEPYLEEADAIRDSVQNPDPALSEEEQLMLEAEAPQRQAELTLGAGNTVFEILEENVWVPY